MKILVAVEPSEMGQRVWGRAQLAAERLDADLNAITIVEPISHYYPESDFGTIGATAADWERSAVNEHSTYLIKHLEGLDTTNLCSRVGKPAIEIAAEAERIGAELIVIGVHNRKGIQKFVGSTTLGVLNRTSLPLLAVHPDSDLEPYDKIMAAVDSTDVSGAVLDAARSWATAPEHITITSVMMPLSRVAVAPYVSPALDINSTALVEKLTTQARERLESLNAEHGLAASTLRMLSGDPRAEIVELARANETDLLIVGSHRRGAINRLLLGSVARGILDATPCDTLIIRE